jgi:hypothetical protein
MPWVFCAYATNKKSPKRLLKIDDTDVEIHESKDESKGTHYQDKAMSWFMWIQLLVFVSLPPPSLDGYPYTKETKDEKEDCKGQ